MSFLSVILWVLAGTFLLAAASGLLFDAFLDPIICPDVEPRRSAPSGQSLRTGLRRYLPIQALLTFFSVVAAIALGGVTDLWTFLLAAALGTLIPMLLLGSVWAAWLAGHLVAGLLGRRKRRA